MSLPAPLPSTYLTTYLPTNQPSTYLSTYQSKRYHFREGKNAEIQYVTFRHGTLTFTPVQYNLYFTGRSCQTKLGLGALRWMEKIRLSHCFSLFVCLCLSLFVCRFVCLSGCLSVVMSYIGDQHN